MQKAKEQAMLSNCPQTHWGAILVNWEGEIVGAGFNYVPSDELFRYCNPCIRKHMRSCTKQEMCSARHAEVLCVENAVVEHGIDAASYCNLYLYGYDRTENRPDSPIIMEYYPCMECAKALMYYKVEKVFFYRPVARNPEEALYLPKAGPRSKFNFNMKRKYELDYIEGEQLWFHPSIWLGLAGDEIKVDGYKLGRKYKKPTEDYKLRELLQAEIGEPPIIGTPDDYQLGLMRWIIDQVLKEGYIDLAEYSLDLKKRMSMPKASAYDHSTPEVEIIFIDYPYQIRRHTNVRRY